MHLEHIYFNEFPSKIPEELKYVSSENMDSSLKVLGSRIVTFVVFEFSTVLIFALKKILSVLSMIFDPLGFSFSFTLAVNCDNPVIGGLKSHWGEFNKEFHLLKTVSISRHSGDTKNPPIILV